MRVACPRCGGEISDSVTRCRHCFAHVVPARRAGVDAAEARRPGLSLGEAIAVTATACVVVVGAVLLLGRYGVPWLAEKLALERAAELVFVAVLAQSFVLVAVAGAAALWRDALAAQPVVTVEPPPPLPAFGLYLAG